MTTSVHTRLWGPRGARLLRGDLAVAAILLAAVALLFRYPAAGRGAPAGVEVRAGDGSLRRLPVDSEGTYAAGGPLGETRFEIAGGRVRVLSSPCPLKLCVRAGWIARGGEMIVCLPNEVVIRMAGEPEEGSPDAISQ